MSKFLKLFDNMALLGPSTGIYNKKSSASGGVGRMGICCAHLRKNYLICENWRAFATLLKIGKVLNRRPGYLVIAANESLDD